jgi:metallo-beta-lactamase class B
MKPACVSRGRQWFQARLAFAPLALLLCATSAFAQEEGQKPPTWEELGKKPPLFLTLMNKALGWQEPAKPAKIAGPLYFVGTRGLGVFLIETSEGGILINTGMPSSGPMIEQSIKELGFDPTRIKIILACHGHVDHVGAHSYIKKLSGARIAMMEPDAELLESGGQSDFFYSGQQGFGYESVAVDQVLRDGDRVTLGDFTIEALLTAGHTRGATTFVFDVVDNGKSYRVVMPDGTGVNPGYRVTAQPSYPGNGRDYKTTYHRLEMLEPDIWLPPHNEVGNLMDKIDRARAEGASAFVDPVGYDSFVRKQRASFQERVDAERAETP